MVRSLELYNTRRPTPTCGNNNTNNINNNEESHDTGECPRDPMGCAIWTLCLLCNLATVERHRRWLVSQTRLARVLEHLVLIAPWPPQHMSQTESERDRRGNSNKHNAGSGVECSATAQVRFLAAKLQITLR
jgi:hypothetical protein